MTENQIKHSTKEIKQTEESRDYFTVNFISIFIGYLNFYIAQTLGLNVIQHLY